MLQKSAKIFVAPNYLHNSLWAHNLVTLDIKYDASERWSCNKSQKLKYNGTGNRISDLRPRGPSLSWWRGWSQPRGALAAGCAGVGNPEGGGTGRTCKGEVLSSLSSTYRLLTRSSQLGITFTSILSLPFAIRLYIYNVLSNEYQDHTQSNQSRNLLRSEILTNFDNSQFY